ncbi:RnfABCDGE type electron transport complex subunit D [Alicyclobacillus sp. SO9]|uniref:RnfABCDGE type electron transport complex subunit D n=1 Tax=Alicyclobacillus sp. SO9 TaxID=2665646 RepID=UPI0018E7DAE1|nr:RnfABCDGE type electron transport complex subunit D [Alicyclobacillus sp. SO9]QQE77563.1 RnfABCDGE type electron transport complex subunit D [Alicyclobacillus sp. SO9]
MNDYNRTANPAMPSRKPSPSQSRGAAGQNQAGAQTQAMPGPVRKFLRTPKGTVLWLLLGLMLVAALHSSDRPGIANVLAAAFTAAMIDLLLAVMRRNKRVFPDGGIITGVIVGLVLSGTVHWQVAAVTAAIAVASKHVLKIKRKPIFNPAAFALLFALLVFHTGQSWWGDLADIPVYFLPLLVAGGYLITGKVNKFPQVLTYLGTYFLLLTLAASLHFGNAAYTPGDAMRIPIVNAALFLAFFMLTDPPTSPAKYGDQVMFSVIAAVASVGVYLVFGGLSYLFIGLLVANAYKAVKSLGFGS